MKIIATKPVSIFWQLIFAVFLPVLDIWVFLRIKKLRKMILYTVLPPIVLLLLIISFIGSTGEILANVVILAFTILYIYLIYKWSVQWNKQFLTDSPEY